MIRRERRPRLEVVAAANGGGGWDSNPPTGRLPWGSTYPLRGKMCPSGVGYFAHGEFIHRRGCYTRLETPPVNWGLLVSLLGCVGFWSAVVSSIVAAF